MSDRDPFFVGWQGRVPSPTAGRLRAIVLGISACALAIAALFAALQRTIGTARWEYGVEREYAGAFLAQPVPMLLLDAPDPIAGTSVFLLVNPAKYGFSTENMAALHLHRVSLRASLLHHDSGAMLEVVPGSLTALPELCGEPERVSLGVRRLVGEIVDSKCYLGAMNPGVLKPHRACAIRCLSGGIPPVLIVRHRGAPATQYVLTGQDDQPVNDAIFEFVADPVAVSGEVLRIGNLLFLRIDPAAVSRRPDAGTRPTLPTSDA